MNELEQLFEMNFISDIYETKIRNKSGRGIDRMSVIDFDRKKEVHFSTIARKCCSGTYKFSLYLQRLILKGPHSKPRSISIPTVRYKIVLKILNIILQNYFPDCVKRELPNVKVRNLASQISSHDNALYLHRLDIKSYYDNINIEKLCSILTGSNIPPAILALIRGAITTQSVQSGHHKSDLHNIIPTNGVPQGLPISNMLAEIYLRNIDTELKAKFEYYDRYVDDIVILSKTKDNIDKYCEAVFSDIDLELNTEKTKYFCQDSPVQFLGYTLLQNEITVKATTLEKHLRSISMMFARLKKTLSLEKKRKRKIGVGIIKSAFVEDLNVKIAGAKYQNKRYGWLQYFSEITDTQIPYLIDNFVRTQFQKSPVFSTIPPDLKHASRAFYELKFSGKSTTYLHNYEEVDTQKKRDWLTKRGLAPGTFTGPNIDQLYAYHVGRFLSQIERDMGLDYKI
ncbi:hypothetical protein SDC9_70731 [bioreactor metagenome]|uniref:Reverse transcriptase domain-containing protein n=1 Tax=bioreactor metagenome TaxID=1076179 RepID=A0A644Y723_9ZZZZ|nr:reverse transcriptase domain-containing protein [Desulfovibrio desulfuricans]MCB6543455.1 reverse transcriptase [Desulfovibrio desulfuricans]MCB6554543.1 reverse transcriptase [Desulfovibrio desulfuricans]MCB6566394.1 reverse transcriptase [Desulfovibrio desulfuricans]MCB7347564.1 reverse transcriptase [Desulfovibrio desulfuricans]MCQ4861522.1 reverse transcriptase domain-containing protein [Desulfovibrio desulfuricans]